MVLNIMFFYGFAPSSIQPADNRSIPTGLSTPLIWTLHLIVGFLAGMIFTKKRYLLSGSMGSLCAFLITGVSFLYFGWRETVSIAELLIPLIIGILPAVKLYDFLNRKYPLESTQKEEA
jgi:hypothetical protein